MHILYMFRLREKISSDHHLFNSATTLPWINTFLKTLTLATLSTSTIYYSSRHGSAAYFRRSLLGSIAIASVVEVMLLTVIAFRDLEDVSYLRNESIAGMSGMVVVAGVGQE